MDGYVLCVWHPVTVNEWQVVMQQTAHQFLDAEQ